MISSTGVEWEPVEDRAELVARVMEMEAQDGRSITQLVGDMGRGSRISDADRLLKLCGSSYAEFLGKGFAFDDLVAVVEAVYSAVGFTARRKASPGATGRRSQKS